MIFGISGLPFSGKRVVVEHMESIGFKSVQVHSKIDQSTQDTEESKDQV